MEKVRALLLDVIGGEGFKEIEVGELQDYYDALKCDCFDIANRNVGIKTKKRFDIFVDDCGLFVQNPIVSALDTGLNPALVGNLIFTHHDVAGNTTGVSDEDIEHIKKSAIMIVNADKAESWPAVVVDY